MTSLDSPRSILVVDDDVALRKVIEVALLERGHRVIGTSGRSEVMALLQSKRFDLVVTDVLMPEMEGTEVIRAVRKFQPDASIVAMSGGGSRISPELCLEIASRMGAGVPLMKPFAIEEFLRAVERAFTVPPSSKHRNRA